MNKSKVSCFGPVLRVFLNDASPTTKAANSQKIITYFLNSNDVLVPGNIKSSKKRIDVFEDLACFELIRIVTSDMM